MRRLILIIGTAAFVFSALEILRSVRKRNQLARPQKPSEQSISSDSTRSDVEESLRAASNNSAALVQTAELSIEGQSVTDHPDTQSAADVNNTSLGDDYLPDIMAGSVTLDDGVIHQIESGPLAAVINKELGDPIAEEQRVSPETEPDVSPQLLVSLVEVPPPDLPIVPYPDVATTEVQAQIQAEIKVQIGDYQSDPTVEKQASVESTQGDDVLTLAASSNEVTASDVQSVSDPDDATAGIETESQISIDINEPEAASAGMGQPQRPRISTYRPSPGRSYAQSKRHRRATAMPARLFVKANFEKGDFVRIALLPKRIAGMPEYAGVTCGITALELKRHGDDWYADVIPPEMERILHEGTEFKDNKAKLRWVLTRRDIYVLSSMEGISGYVSSPRLVIGKKHLVLCRQERHDEVLEMISAAGSNDPRLIDDSCGIPTGWVVFADVIPRQARPFAKGAGILNILRPSAQIEIALEGGVRLERATWLSGCPPSVRVYGDTTASPVLIDGELAQREADDSFTIPMMSEEGPHLVTCAGASRSYMIEAGTTEWPIWSAHPCGQPGGEDDQVFICGALAEQKSSNVPISGIPDVLEWCVRRGEDTSPWAQETIPLSTAEFVPNSESVLLFRWPKRRWLREVSIKLDRYRVGLHGSPSKAELMVPLSTFPTPLSEDIVSAPILASCPLGSFNVAVVHRAWAVKGLRCIEEFAGDAVVLRFHWSEVGLALDRTLSFYRDKSTTLFRKDLDADQYAVVARFPTTAITPGRYTIEIAGRDVGGASVTRCCPIIVELLGIDHLMRDSVIRFQSVRYLEEVYLLDGLQCDVQVSGRITTGKVPSDLNSRHALIKSINDGWYVGTLTVHEGGRDVTAEYVDNPIKFEFDSEHNEITAIEDKTGDGAIFCPLCKRLFWTRAMEKAERKKRHRKHLSLDFAVRITARKRRDPRDRDFQSRIVP